MSDIAFRAPHFASSTSLGTWVRALTGKWFARGLPIRELQSLNDRLLVDIGIDPRHVPRSSMEEADRLRLMERGWRPPRASRQYRRSD